MQKMGLSPSCDGFWILLDISVITGAPAHQVLMASVCFCLCVPVLVGRVAISATASNPFLPLPLVSRLPEHFLQEPKGLVWPATYTRELNPFPQLASPCLARSDLRSEWCGGLPAHFNFLGQMTPFSITYSDKSPRTPCYHFMPICLFSCILPPVSAHPVSLLGEQSSNLEFQGQGRARQARAWQGKKKRRENAS